MGNGKSVNYITRFFGRAIANRFLKMVTLNLNDKRSDEE
jgi:hypothetical protein